MLNRFVIIDINVKSIIDKYAQIDAFSQSKLLKRKSNFTARNMGKNNLWIAATASVFNIQLLTTDNDFRHLNNEFISLAHIVL